jgi:antitoxin component YwqK of YwqJK toxin-antitoxin module
MLKLLLKTYWIGTLFLIAACSQYYSDQNIEIKEDGLIYKVGQPAPFTGRVIDTLNNKVLEYDVLNGLKNGEFRVSSVDGIMSVYGFVIDNLNNGEWKYFYPNGQIESTGNFLNDNPHGKWTWFYGNGSVKETGTFFEGKKTGKWFTYNQKGMINNMTYYNNGEIVNDVKYNFSISI